MTEECQRASVREICITDEVSDHVGGKEPSLWIIGGQEFHDAEPVLLILPVGLEIIYELRSQHRRSPCSRVLAQNSRYKNGTTKACSIALSVVPYRALQSDRCSIGRRSRRRQVSKAGRGNC